MLRLTVGEDLSCNEINCSNEAFSICKCFYEFFGFVAAYQPMIIEIARDVRKTNINNKRNIIWHEYYSCHIK